MKSMRIIVLAMAALLMSSTAWAQAPHSGKKGMKKEARKEIRAYVQSEIMPIIKPLRAQLDQQLSASELREIKEIRSELKAFRKEKKEQGPAMREARKNQTQPTPEMIEARRAAFKKQRLLMTRAWTIVDANEDAIFGLLDQTNDLRPQWHEGIQNILKKHKPEGADKMAPPAHPYMRGMGKPGPAHFRGGAGGIKHLLQPIGFLLWDGEVHQREGKGKKGKGRQGFAPSDSGNGLDIYPNPSLQNNQLRYTVEADGPVKITLADAQGKTIKKLYTGTQTQGDYTQTFDVSNLAAGTYLYEVKTASGKMVKRFVVE